MDLDLISIFGLLDSCRPKPPEGSVSSSYSLDSFLVDETPTVATLRCKCGRSAPLYVAVEDLRRAHRVQGLYACSLCLSELREARSPSDKVAVWFRQNRPSLTHEAHIYLPTSFARLMDATEKTVMRPRRFVYAKFNNVSLSDKDKILTTCGDVECVNPLHMMLAASPAAKVTPAMREDVKTWIAKHIPRSQIQDMIESKYNRRVSLRTITNIKNSVPA